MKPAKEPPIRLGNGSGDHSSDKEALDRFLAWGAQYQGFPYSSVSYWVNAYLRNDGKDMYENELKR